MLCGWAGHAWARAHTAEDRGVDPSCSLLLFEPRSGFNPGAQDTVMIFHCIPGPVVVGLTRRVARTPLSSPLQGQKRKGSTFGCSPEKGCRHLLLYKRHSSVEADGKRGRNPDREVHEIEPLLRPGSSDENPNCATAELLLEVRMDWCSKSSVPPLLRSRVFNAFAVGLLLLLSKAWGVM